MAVKTAPKKLPRRNPITQPLLDSAYAQQKTGHVSQAEILYQKVLALEPGNPFALYALGTCAMQRGNMAAAVPFLRLALVQGYLNETVFTHLGIALQSQGLFDEAIEVYRVAAKGDPKNPRYASNAAVVLAQKGDFDAAIAEARKALKLDRNFVPNLVNLAFYLQEQGNLEEAAKTFEKALRLEPDQEPVKAALLALRQKLGEDK